MLYRIKKLLGLNWEYVGTVEGVSRVKDEDGKVAYQMSGFWVLLEQRSGRRKFIQNGDAGRSPYAEAQRAAVRAWINGGPLPQNTAPPPVEDRPKAKLLVFNGDRKD